MGETDDAPAGEEWEAFEREEHVDAETIAEDAAELFGKTTLSPPADSDVPPPG